jgi:hypothetical protein
MSGVVMNTPAADLGEGCKVLTCGEAPSQLMGGLAANGVQPVAISMDPAPVQVAAPSAPKEDFMASFKASTPSAP